MNRGPSSEDDWFTRELTFYHEVGIPQNPFFSGERRGDGRPLLVVSSPSRMGNHLLMSMLDNHPELPRVPGEDGLLLFAFNRAQYDLGVLRKDLADAGAVENLMKIAANSPESKWRRYDKLARGELSGPAKVSGIKAGSGSAVQDFEGVVVPVDFHAYEQHLEKSVGRIRSAGKFWEVLDIYLEAMALLDPEANQRHGLKYARYLVHGAMRSQLRWLCESDESVKILISVRSFPSYAISQIRSRHGAVELTDELLQEAWEHWFHKIIDAAWLGHHFPEKVGLVTFEDMTGSSEEVASSICRFLGISLSEAMHQATIFGQPVKGNSWNSRRSEDSGKFYRPEVVLSGDMIPARAGEIWKKLNQLKLKA